MSQQTLSILHTRDDREIPVGGQYTIDPAHTSVDLDGANASPMGDERVAFSAAADVDREDWGLTWNVALERGGLLVGKQVHLELNVQATATARK
jgi:hypothetical protein